MENTLTYLGTLARETHNPESEVMTMVFQVGVRQLWREHILAVPASSDFARRSHSSRGNCLG